MPDPAHDLATSLRAQRRGRRLSLRDLAAEIDVSFNTLSRVERGHVPDLPNYRKIAAWLDIPTEALFEAAAPTPDVIARHLNADKTLSADAAAKIASVVADMYARLTLEQPRVACHLRSAQTFTPQAGELLADILGEMQAQLVQQP